MSTEQPPTSDTCWLDSIIRQQAAHYGLTVGQFNSLMSGAANMQEKIELHEITEDEARGETK